MPFWFRWGYYSSPERAAEAFENLYGDSAPATIYVRITRDDSRNPRWLMELSFWPPTADEAAAREVIR